MYFRVFRYSEFISLMWKEPYYDKLQLQEGYFSIQGKLCADSNSEKSDPMFPFERPSLRVRTLISQQLTSERGGKTVRTPISV
jgi:hypothetical protein